MVAYPMHLAQRNCLQALVQVPASRGTVYNPDTLEACIWVLANTEGSLVNRTGRCIVSLSLGAA